MPPFLYHVSNSFEHLQPLCCPSHPRFLSSLMHLQILSSRFNVPMGQINHTNRCVEVIEYLNSAISVLNLAQRNIETRGKGFASASDCLETWDDSDSITAVNARKDWRHATKMVA